MNVIDLASEESVDAAWEAYAVEARTLVGHPDLIHNRAFNEKLARLHERWKRLFLIQEAGR